MATLLLSSAEYKKKVKGAPYTLSPIDNEPVSDESIWDFIEKGAVAVGESNPQIKDWIFEKKQAGE